MGNKMKLTSLWAGLAVAVCVAGSPLYASAKIVQYIYKGPYYNSFNGESDPYTTRTHVKGSFEIDTSLIEADVDPSFGVFYGSSSLLTSYYFTDGVTTVSSADPASGNLVVGGILFNLSGMIAGYAFSGETLGYPSSYPYSTLSIEGSTPAPNSVLFSGVDGSGTSYLYNSTPLSHGGEVVYKNLPDLWSRPLGVPEPGAWATMVFGLAFIGASMRTLRTRKGLA